MGYRDFQNDHTFITDGIRFMHKTAETHLFLGWQVSGCDGKQRWFSFCLPDADADAH
jgi:hypothetical protein